MDTATQIPPPLDLDASASMDLEARIRRTTGNRLPDPETQLTLADALFDKGDDVEAVRMLQALLYVDAKCVRAYDLLVDIYTKLGRRREAAEMYREWGKQLSEAGSLQVLSKEGLADTAVADSVAAYYAIRAPEYEETSSYMKARSSRVVELVKSELRAVVQDRDAIEIACGTGFWTQVAAEAARTLLATDRNVELIEIVSKKVEAHPHVACQPADAYTLEGVAGSFTAAYAQFWWSHVPRSMLRRFLNTLHSKLVEGSPVFFMDTMPYVTRGPRRVDKEGNVVEPRVLLNGDEYEVIKNFPTEAEVREALEGIAEDVVYKEYGNASIWSVTYRTKTAEGVQQ